MFDFLISNLYYCVTMMTIKDFAKAKGVAVQTVYTWINRGQEKQKKFKVVKIGNVHLIKIIK